MVHLFFGLLLALLSFGLIGIGPALFLNPGRNRWGVAIALAPVVGFVLVTIFGTYLTLADIKVARWTLPLLVVGTSMSLLLILLRHHTEQPRATPEGLHVAIWGASGFIFTLAVIAAPQMLGGLQFSVLRGNGTDSFNYIATADYLDREPLSWANRTDRQTLVDRDPSYELARELLITRWSTFMMLAFSSRTGQTPPYIFEYCFSLLCFLMAYGPAFLYARSLQLMLGAAALTAGAICVGFWAQVILDTRAQSQLNSIPVLLLFMLLLSRIEDRVAGTAPGAVYAIAGATGLSLEFLYPDILPLVVLTLLIFFATRLRSLDLASFSIRRYTLTCAVLLLGSLPMWKLLSRFAASQISYAAAGKNNWDLAYYSWLYSNLPAGFWGFGPLESSGTALSIMGGALVTLLGVALTILLAFALIHSLRKGGPGLRLAACTSAAAMVEFGYLAARDQRWAAAKGLSFGYAFVTLTLVGCFLAGSTGPGSILVGQWKRLAVACVMAFLLFQNALGIWRPWLTVRNEDYAHYIWHHGEYRRHSWDVNAIQKALAGQTGIAVWSDVSSGWVSEYLDFAFGGQVKFVNVGANLDPIQSPAGGRHLSTLPRYLIVENAVIPSSATAGLNAGVIAKTPEFSLVRGDSGGPALASVINPNGLEKTPDGRLYFWMGGNPTIFSLLSSTDGCAIFSGDAILGPSSNLPYRTLIVGSAASENRGSVVFNDGPVRWQARVRIGLNEVPVAVKEEAIQFLPADHRPLLLRVDNLKIEGRTCESNLP